jgi:hypothetical protein
MNTLSKEEHLLSYIKKYGHFSIVFDNPHFFGIYNQVFKDKGVVSEVERFLRHFKPISALNNAISEKGIPNITKTQFDPDCIFGVIEQNSTLDNLICDDMGDEWADFIEFGTTGDSTHIRFIHCKHGKEDGLGASPFHDVVSQALKNLSHLFAGQDEITRKITTWRGNISGTQIQNIRKEGPQGLGNEYQHTLGDHNIIREVILAVTFLKRTEIVAMVARIKTGVPPKPHEAQLVWLISTFILGAQQMGAHPYIYCKP